MGTKKQIAELLRQIDIIENEMLLLKNKQNDIYRSINSIKEKIIKDNSYLIGKKAICSIENNPNFQDIECICSKIVCNEYYLPVPLFKTKSGKKVHIDFYEWV
ncbi:MAG: hypothetical protein MK076_00915 [Flavobacteriales bacterium]|nr:hypothetical protein [Flavobacteriales bacterium]